MCLISSYGQSKITWISTTSVEQWKTQKIVSSPNRSGQIDVEVKMNKPQQTIDGFGTCFNELGWTSLSALSTKDREDIMRELFAPGTGANFTICRMPVGANDFSRSWYSYDEIDSDFEMKNFSIANDLQTLIPFIKNAQKYNPNLKLWASPWSPPTWMKYNHHYACRSVLGNVNFVSEKFGIDMRGINNHLPKTGECTEGSDMFIQDERHFQAYSLYFTKFIEAYRKEGINVGMVMPQNEFNSAQPFPSCTWTAAGLSKFISYLGPHMQRLGVKLFFGTVERGNAKLVDTIINSTLGGKFISGAGFQWAGKDAIPTIHQRYPNLILYQSEQECGNGKNDWDYCEYTWTLMKHYLTNGANAYMYWNTSLKQGGISTWGWKQNSLVSVDTINKTFNYNYEYYLMKHLSHFVNPGATRLETTGNFNNLLAFLNPDRSVIIVAENDADQERELVIRVRNTIINPKLKAHSFNTIRVAN